MIGKGQTVTLTGTLALSGAQWRVVVQESSSTDPLRGVFLTTTADYTDKAIDFDAGGAALSSGTSRLVIAGVHRKFLDFGTVSSGASVSLTVNEADLSNTVRRDGTYTILLLVGDTGGTTWGIGASWTLTMRTTITPFWVRAARRPVNNALLLYIRCDNEDTVSATVAWTGDSRTIVWSGTRHQPTGMKAFYFELPPLEESVDITVTDSYGNTTTTTRAAPPFDQTNLTPRTLPTWNHPRLLPRTGRLDALYTSIENALPNTRSAPADLNINNAQGSALEQHATLQGVKRLNLEPDTSLRNRALAVVRGFFLTRQNLEKHLSDVVGSTVTIRDNTFSRVDNAPFLDGSRFLDGDWELGGVAATFAPATYLVSFREPLDTPLERGLVELHRLRPLGTKPIIEHRIESYGTLFPRLAGISG